MDIFTKLRIGFILEKLSKEQMHQVCDELRQYIIDVVSVHGGHFGASCRQTQFGRALQANGKKIWANVFVAKSPVVTVP